ncbi:MAG: ISNCY family transposase, partial [Thermovirgaceae bacterium]|nr:ISNCY family transposase [Thermovirgaceae bacterium]
RPRFGEMLQIDASPFDWLSNGSMISLHGAIDDATGKVVALWLEPTERLNGYFKVLKRTILTYGVPRSIYSDAHSIFFSPKSGKLTVQDELEGKSVAFTQFGKALEILGINPIKALSPQAKGRIERLWGTLQHRLVVDMRVAGIKTIDEANAFLASYVIKHDGLFAVAPEEEESAFLPAPSEEDLEYILCRRENRKASGDSTISWKGKKWMAVDAKKRQILLKRSATVEILTLLDDSIALQHDGNIFRLERFITAPMEEKNPSGAKDLEKARETPHIPAPDHPWRRWNEKRKKKEKSPLHIVTAGTEG